MDSLLIFASGLIAGLAVGAWAAWQMWLRNERPVVHANLVIDPAVLHQINASMTLAWLDKQGLTWTAKGIDFDHDGVKR